MYFALFIPIIPLLEMKYNVWQLPAAGLRTKANFQSVDIILSCNIFMAGSYTFCKSQSYINLITVEYIAT